MKNNYKIRIQHVAIHVRNLEESIKWYSDILGFELIRYFDNTNLGCIMPDCAQMANGDFYLELYETPSAENYSLVDLEYSLGVKHFSLSIPNLEEFMSEIRERGDVDIAVDNEYSEEMCHVPGGDCAAFIKDCNGILIELQKVHDWR